MAYPLLFTGARELLSMPWSVPADAAPEEALGLLTDAAFAVDDAGRVVWCGPRAQAPPAARTVDLGGRVVVPGLVDAHTHLVYAGDRTHDFALRCAGASYAEIAARGGGIRLTVRETRAASVEALVALARPRLHRLLAHGATTVEIKSGYGLDVDAELRQLEAARALREEGPVRILSTCLGAHTVPDEYTSDRPQWIRILSVQLLPMVRERQLAEFFDVFCDAGAYTLNEAQSLLRAAARLGFGLKAHGEQLTHTGVAALAAGLGAVSVDHLEHLDDAGVAALAAAGTVAVLLPGASVFLGDPARPPVRALRAAGVRMALATDANPGSSPTTHPWLIATLGCTWYGLAPHEALRGLTVHGAAALGLRDGTGSLRPGSPADFAVCDVPGWRHLVYGFGDAPVDETWIGGAQAYARPRGC